MEKLFKKTFAILALLVLTAFTIPTTVYICLSPGGKKYHYDRGCRGLNNCTHEIKAVSKGDAEGRGLDLCGWED
ncbi:MAG: hypothetical protein K0R51_1554 [Cytophagaceae bacterium]|jgi:hypothetical protein|nr:hypothetical protein [Cytophagaceae bacterium]